MILEWPQIVYAALIAMSLGMALAKDGEPKGNWSFWWNLVATVILVFLLYKGGFWAGCA